MPTWAIARPSDTETAAVNGQQLLTLTYVLSRMDTHAALELYAGLDGRGTEQCIKENAAVQAQTEGIRVYAFVGEVYHGPGAMRYTPQTSHRCAALKNTPKQTKPLQNADAGRLHHKASTHWAWRQH